MQQLLPHQRQQLTQKILLGRSIVMNNAAQDYQKLLTEVLQKQIIILGPEITLLKARNVPGLSVADDGHVTSISGDPKETAIKLLEQFRELSPLLVKKTMNQLLSAIISSYPSQAATPAQEQKTENTQEHTEANNQTQPTPTNPALIAEAKPETQPVATSP
jgi:hypothetical protein